MKVFWQMPNFISSGARSLILTLVLASLGCQTSSSPFGQTPAPAAAVAGTSSALSCTTTTVDVGQKNTTLAVARGTYSDTKVAPGTGNPATAFVDAGSTSLKFSFWNGVSFTTEPVSGDSSAAFIKLVFLSNGLPMIFWAQGASVKVAIRSAAVPGSGTWTAGVIDTGVAPRAISASVNPLDQVAVVFATDIVTTGRMKFMYCDAPCTTASGFQTMTTTPFIENTALIPGVTSTGVAWCKASAASYFPAAVYSVTGVTRYAVCQSSLANCLTNTNWTLQTVVGTGNLASRLVIDPTITGDEAKVASLGAAGVTLFKMSGVACTAAPAAFTTGSTIGTASTGTQWLDLLKDSTAGKFHLVANESTTSVRYYNSATTDIVGAWNGAGVIETVTTPNLTGGGADVDSTTTGIYASYGTSSGSFDIRLGRVTSYSTASSAGVFTKYDIDRSGNMQLTGSTMSNVATASTSGGRPAVAYNDFSIGTIAGARLKYALRNGPGATSAWSAQVIPDTLNPQFPSLAFDHLNRPWISYFDSGLNRYFVVTNSATDGSGSWTAYEFPAIAAGGAIALPAANNTAMAMSYSAGVASPVMLVIDTNAGSKGIKAAKLSAGTLTWGAVATIDALTVSGASQISADYDTNGNIVVAYRDLGAAKTKYAASTDGTTWSTPLLISAVNQGVGNSIKINPATQRPAISYYDRPNNAVYYSACTATTLAGCNTTGWVTTLVDNVAGVSGVSSGNEQSLMTGLVFSQTGRAWISYVRGQASSGSLMVADNNGGGSFAISTLAAGANGGLTGTPPLNFGIAGWNVAASRNAAGQFTALYIGAGDWLSTTSCGD